MFLMPKCWHLHTNAEASRAFILQLSFGLEISTAELAVWHDPSFLRHTTDFNLFLFSYCTLLQSLWFCVYLLQWAHDLESVDHSTVQSWFSLKILIMPIFYAKTFLKKCYIIQEIPLLCLITFAICNIIDVFFCDALRSLLCIHHIRHIVRCALFMSSSNFIDIYSWAFHL